MLGWDFFAGQNEAHINISQTKGQAKRLPYSICAVPAANEDASKQLATPLVSCLRDPLRERILRYLDKSRVSLYL